jgi:hypothetical protein
VFSDHAELDDSLGFKVSNLPGFPVKWNGWYVILWRWLSIRHRAISSPVYLGISSA